MKIERLPLFPLSAVLMPGAALPLHIFEPRYRLMMKHVLDGERRFGVLLYRETPGDLDASVHAHEVGTIAEVTDLVPLQDGLMNVSTTGRQRFRVTRFYHDRPYLTGDVELLTESFEPSQRLRALHDEVRRLSLRYVTTVLTLNNEQATQVRLPSDPVQLSFKVAGLLVSMKPSEAQHLLEASDVEWRLSAEIIVLRRELVILHQMSRMPDPAGRPCPN